MELAAKLEAALVKYLQTIDPSPWPAYFTAADQVHPGESDEDKDTQLVLCRAAEQAESEFPQFSGNFWWPVEVELRTPAAVQTAAQAASADPAEATSQLDKHRAVAQALQAAIMVNNLPTLLNLAAVALGEGYELTVLGVLDRVPGRSQAEGVYSSGWSLRIYCCSSALS